MIPYDNIAGRYDELPVRQKVADVHLAAFGATRPFPTPSPLVLDIGCGTGNQLTANQQAWPTLRQVGVDLSAGMLRQAQQKNGRIPWVQSNAAQLPFAEATFDYISCQFSYHLWADKAGGFAEIWRVLRGNGRFLLTNLNPDAMPGWHYYHYFPAAQHLDLRRFWPVPTLVAYLRHLGFTTIQVSAVQKSWAEPLADFAHLVRQRHHTSQLMGISDADYETGCVAVETAVRQTPTAHIPSQLNLLTLLADKPPYDW